MENFEILFIDDDRQILDIVQQFLSRYGFNTTTETNSTKALERIKTNQYDIVFTDLIMPEVGGLDLLKEVKQRHPDTEVVIVTGYGSIETAIQALKLGSYDYLQKPINFERFKIIINRIIEKKKLKEENLLIKKRLKERYKYDELVGISPKMQEIYKVIDKISMGGPTVLIQGESGTGKELVANVIHRNSNRKNRPFIPVNCSAIAESILERELFGHKKGAFTGAIQDSIGLFKAADKGTIFLDEIAEISPAVQVKLLRVLQERKIRPVGDIKEEDVDVRVIAATNKDLDEAIKNNSFREDLYYRLNVISFKMPPLRESTEDIPFLLNHFISNFGSQTDNRLMHVSPEAMDIMTSYQWPGNVRQLENVIERAFALGVTDVLQVSDLPEEIQAFGDTIHISSMNFNLKDNEKILIEKALRKTGGDKAQAAKLLGINTTTVYRKLARLGISDRNT